MKRIKVIGDTDVLFMGIDPGQTGAIALIDKKQEVYLLRDYPGDEVAAAEIVSEIIGRFGMEYRSRLFAALEKVHAMGMPGKPCPVCKRRPAQGVTSTFKFGMNFGIWKGILAAFSIPFILPAPQTWQKGIIAKAQDKSPAVAAAARMFPSIKTQLYGPRGGKKDGRADALLIADYCRRQYL